MRGQLRHLVVVEMNPSISMCLSYNALQMIIEADVINPVEKILQIPLQMQTITAKEHDLMKSVSSVLFVVLLSTFRRTLCYFPKRQSVIVYIILAVVLLNNETLFLSTSSHSICCYQCFFVFCLFCFVFYVHYTIPIDSQNIFVNGIKVTVYPKMKILS